MELYLVGGAVRDKLLGKPVQDRDWVVVGATPQEMLAKGFRQVGADFPVFLHPETHEEYALARTERKQGHGYHGFTVHSAPDVTLEEDLQRRDLTINAMAQAEDGAIVDPFNGRRDLEQRVLRHVSPAFAEDPLRILRLARFAARFAPLGFTVAAETQELMAAMVASGEADHLVPERTWQETRRALHENSPRTYFEVLRDCGALAVVMPELNALFGVPQAPEKHPEIDTGEHILLNLSRAAALSDETPVRFAALTQDLGKALTPIAQWPDHQGHETRGCEPLQSLCERLKVPNDCRELAVLANNFHSQIHRVQTLEPGELLSLLDQVDAWRRPERFEQLLEACEADARGRAGRADHPYPQADFLRRVLCAARQVQARQFLDQGLSGPAVGDAIREGRLQRIITVVGQSGDRQSPDAV